MSDSDTSDNEDELDTLDTGIECNLQQSRIESIVCNYLDSSGELPWRIFRQNSDEYVLWTAASRKIFVAPVYSDEPVTDDGPPHVIRRAYYYDRPLLSYENAMNKTFYYMTDSEIKAFEREMEEDTPGSLVNFIVDVLTACDKPTDALHIFNFLADLDYTGLLRP